MNDSEQFDDPLFARRIRDWANAQGEVRAPDRLVGSVMAEVMSSPRRQRRRPWAWAAPRWQGAAAYGALTAVIAVGVALGILAASAIENGVGMPTASPSQRSEPTSSPLVAATPSPVVMPTPRALASLPTVAFSATAVAAAGNTIWAADRGNVLAELDPSSGAILRTVTLPRTVHALLVTADHVWASSADGPLVRVDRTTLGLTEVPTAVGIAMAEGSGVIWLGADEAVIRVDAATATESLRAPAANRSADLGVAAVGDAVWVATRTSILRLDQASGAVTASLPGDATGLVADGTWLWAVRGTELVRIDPIAAVPMAYTPGMPGPIVATTSGVTWVVGPAGGGPIGVLVGVDALDVVVYRAELGLAATTMAVGGGAIWLAGDEQGEIHRLALP